MPHESTVTPGQTRFEYKSASLSKNSIDSELNESPRNRRGSASSGQGLNRQQSLVPHLYAEKPTEVTHHHDTDEEESEHSNE